MSKKKKETAKKRINRLPLGSGALSQTAKAIKQRNKKQTEMLKKLNK